MKIVEILPVDGERFLRCDPSSEPCWGARVRTEPQAESLVYGTLRGRAVVLTHIRGRAFAMLVVMGEGAPVVECGDEIEVQS